MLNTFTWIVILLPLSVYFIAVGVLGSSRTPKLVMGGRDFMTLGLGCIGLFLAGPFKLFFPQAAFNFVGGGVWLALALLYLLILSLIAMSQRLRIVVYSCQAIHMQDATRRTLLELDEASSWAGNAFDCPSLEISGTVEQRRGENVAQIVANSRHQDYTNWLLLLKTLEVRIGETPIGKPKPSGWLAAGIALLIVVLTLVISQPESTLSAMRDALRF